MAREQTAPVGRVQSQLAANRVLRNTYLLLSLTLLFSAGVAGTAMALNVPPLGLIITLVGYFGLLFAVEKTKNSGWGLLWTFALTGFMGLTLGPILNLYIAAYANGGQLVMLALGGTGTIFLGLSGYALVSGARFNRWAGALFVGILVAFVLGLGAAIFHIAALSLAVSALFILLMSGLILYETGEIVNGGETNYISATVTLFVSLYNLFLSLLNLLSAFSGSR